jgi:hypothetical protein
LASIKNRAVMAGSSPIDGGVPKKPINTALTGIFSRYYIHRVVILSMRETVWSGCGRMASVRYSEGRAGVRYSEGRAGVRYSEGRAAALVVLRFICVMLLSYYKIMLVHLG